MTVLELGVGFGVIIIVLLIIIANIFSKINHLKDRQDRLINVLHDMDIIYYREGNETWSMQKSSKYVPSYVNREIVKLREKLKLLSDYLGIKIKKQTRQEKLIICDTDNSSNKNKKQKCSCSK